MGWLAAIGNAFGAIKEYFGFASKRSDLNNAPDVRAAEIAKQDQITKAKIELDVAQKNIEAARKDIST